MQQFQQEMQVSGRQPKTRSVVGPVILIGIGFLFLFHNLTGFDVFRMIRNYWPLILIVLGISKLIEYFRVNKQNLS